MSLPKYKYLLTYRLAEIIFDLEVEFEKQYLSGFEHRRTREQRYQSARSGKQNIMEGVGQSNTSKKGEMKLLGVSLGSFEELLGDNEDFLRQRNIPIWSKDHPKIQEYRKIAYNLSHIRNLSDLGHLKEKPILPDNPAEAANFLLTLCHMETYLLSRQIESLEKKFVKTGGFTEKLYNSRVNYRKSPK